MAGAVHWLFPLGVIFGGFNEKPLVVFSVK
jgi:hypothetical protein